MVKAVQNVKGGLADPAAGEEVLEHMVAEQEHELESIQRGDRFEAAIADQTPLLARAWMCEW